MEAKQIRILIRLIDVGLGSLFWAGQFDRDIDSPMLAQQELASRICDAIRLGTEVREGGPANGIPRRVGGWGHAV